MAKPGHGQSENRLHAIEFADHLTVRALITRSRSPGIMFVDLAPVINATANLDHGRGVVLTKGAKQRWAPADRSVHRETPQMRRTQPGSQNCGLWRAPFARAASEDEMADLSMPSTPCYLVGL